VNSQTLGAQTKSLMVAKSLSLNALIKPITLHNKSKTFLIPSISL